MKTPWQNRKKKEVIMSKRIVIIDGNSLINRAYYAMQRPMITKEGIYTQGIYGFLSMLNKINEDYEPGYLTVAFDKKSPTFRHIEYEAYKAGRKKMPPELAMQMPLVKDVLHAMNIETLEIDGFEADDIIGTVARVAEEDGLEPLIITGDKDALQLATDLTKILITKKGISEFDIYDREKMIERYQLTPDQFIDLKGLMGDQSDNIPGIPGVGEKTGIKLLEQFGSMENLLANTDQIKNEKLRTKVEENVQLAAMSKKLATINKYVPIEFEIQKFKTEEPDYEKLIDIYSKLEFNSLLKKLHITNKESFKNDKVYDNNNYVKHTINSISELNQINQTGNLGKLKKNQEAVIKVFSDNNHVEKPEITGISILVGNDYYYFNCQEQGVLEEVVKLLNEKELYIIGHDLKNDYYPLMFAGYTKMLTKFDSAIAEYVIDPTKSNYEIKTLVFENLHYEINDEKTFLESNGQLDLFNDSTVQFSDFGFDWCVAVIRLKELEEATLAKENLNKVYYNVELPLIEVLTAMEFEGFPVDKQTLSDFGDTLKEELSTLEMTIYQLAGSKFNINSPLQLGTVLFETLGLPAGKKSKRGYSTSAEVLGKISTLHPIVDEVLKYRTLSKLNSTYVEGLMPLIGKDKKLRAHFQQTVTATGRISCTEPNLQNIPIRQPQGRLLRKAFSAGDDNYTLVGADYSQIELRILAHLSGDQTLIDAFNNGDDIHRITAARVFNIDYDKVTAEDRSKAKAVNFGVIYGMSGFGLSEELKISRKEAESYINEYFNKHTDVKKYMDEQIEDCKRLGYSTTIMGRKRTIHEINSSTYMTRQFGERLAMNSPVQGSAADIIKLAMIKVYKELKEKHPKSKLILQIHDELIIRTDKSEIDEIEELLKRNMESAIELKVKMTSDLNRGYTWYDLK